MKKRGYGIKNGYIFGILKNGVPQIYQANSSNHAKQIRSVITKTGDIQSVTPIVNLSRATEIPMLLRDIKIKRKGEGSG